MPVPVAKTQKGVSCAPSGTALDIDPRTAPRVPDDESLPLLPPDALQTRRLQQFFLRPVTFAAKPFPPQYAAASADMHAGAPAAVLIALVVPQNATNDAGLEVLFTQRAPTLSTHAGQIAFPGGKVDATDTDPCACAVREAQEEVGLTPDFVEVLGTLPVYTTPRYAITPVVALVRRGFTLTPNPAEVESIFTVPLSFLMNPCKHQRQVYKERCWYAMPYCNTSEAQERYIWGVSAGILRNFYHFLRYACAAS